jgi:hypothetical protein
VPAGKSDKSTNAGARRPRSRSKVNGNDILYHFLQKTLLESDEDQFRELTTRLINELGVWLPTSIYSRFPLLVPYAIRDPYSRGNKATGKPDEWGAPSSSGYFPGRQ